jgi:hypothetical protein
MIPSFQLGRNPLFLSYAGKQIKLRTWAISAWVAFYAGTGFY